MNDVGRTGVAFHYFELAYSLFELIYLKDIGQDRWSKQKLVFNFHYVHFEHERILLCRRLNGDKRVVK